MSRITYSRCPVDLPIGDAHADTVAHLDDARGALRYLVNAHDGEPLVVIRGRDVLALPTLLAYVDLAGKLGLSGQADRMLDHRARFEEWQEEHRHLVKIPDPLPGTYGQPARFSAGQHVVSADQPFNQSKAEPLR